jgi:hypothetical protein
MLDANLYRLAQARVLFGHQSVGRDLVQGLRERTARGEASVAVTPVASAGPATRGVLQFEVGRNGDPQGKTAAFAACLARPSLGPVDLALHKYCYVDVRPGTDVDELFDVYWRAMDVLAAAHPSTRFLHVTIPLVRPAGGLGTVLTRLRGRTPPAVAANARRERFNDRLRHACEAEGGALFDLAAVEATAPDGATATDRAAGQPVRRLVAGYTDDGGHLNAVGRRHVVAAWLDALAAALPAR